MSLVRWVEGAGVQEDLVCCGGKKWWVGCGRGRGVDERDCVDERRDIQCGLQVRIDCIGRG